MSIIKAIDNAKCVCSYFLFANDRSTLSVPSTTIVIWTVQFRKSGKIIWFKGIVMKIKVLFFPIWALQIQPKFGVSQVFFSY